MKNYSKLKDEAIELVGKGKTFIDRMDAFPDLEFQEEYQTWFSLSCRLIERIMPERLKEFKEYYSDGLTTDQSNTMSNYFLKKGSFYSSFQEEVKHYIESFKMQLSILSGVVSCFDSSLLDIQSEIYYEYQEDEIEAAVEVLKINVRAAGIIGRLVIEKHLKTIAEKRLIAVQSKQHNPGLADYILALRRFGCIQEPEKKKLEYLKEIGNKCAHDKGVEPNEAEVSELLDGAKWCLANIL